MSSVYAGKIQNAGTQIVRAPMQSAQAKTGAVRSGQDLRGGMGQPSGTGRSVRKPKAGK